MRIVNAATLAILFSFTASVALAQEETALVDYTLPTAPEAWMNYAPLSLDRLEGKGIILYYFEEDCPKCAARWPKLLEESRQRSLDPIVFIAVNSGTPPAKLAAYLREHQINWPVIADTDRSFERQSIRDPITLQNTTQVRMRPNKGKWEIRSSSRMSAAATAAGKEGRFKVLPATVPLELRPAWGLIELGNFSQALPLLNQATRRGSEEVKASADVLKATVDIEMQKELKAIDELLEADDEWHAYQAIGSLLETYKGYEIPETMIEKHDELAALDSIRDQLVAAKKYDLALRAGSAGTPAAIKRATAMLQRLVDAYPESEAADDARKLLGQLPLSSRN
ncbi:TlpA disulfide reductase family protein [Aeoliella sp. SH292]|uniref:TlpA disulfide reductase family protein n=1 Tax=Aeoliella sp. SH292 TaxID=3454464 RepID=UPI003F9AEEE3